MPDPLPPANPFGGYPSLEIIAREDGTNITLLPKAAILGGVVVKIGDTEMDGSVKKRLNTLRTRLTSGAGAR